MFSLEETYGSPEQIQLPRSLPHASLEEEKCNPPNCGISIDYYPFVSLQRYTTYLLNGEECIKGEVGDQASQSGEGCLHSMYKRSIPWHQVSSPHCLLSCNWGESRKTTNTWLTGLKESIQSPLNFKLFLPEFCPLRTNKDAQYFLESKKVYITVLIFSNEFLKVLNQFYLRQINNNKRNKG